MEERILMNYSKKIIMIAFLFLFAVSGLLPKNIGCILTVNLKMSMRLFQKADKSVREDTLLTRQRKE